jgi:type VI secretion system secreted protein VgrG
LHHNPAQSQLESALALAQSLGETASNQLADTIETGDEGKTVEANNSASSTASTDHLYHHIHASKSFEAGRNTDKDGKTKSKDQAGQQNIMSNSGKNLHYTLINQSRA